MNIKHHRSGMLWVSLVVLAMCVSMLSAETGCTSAPKPVEAAKEAPPADPYADAQILVEAFVVEVTTAGLKDLGVSPLGQTPDGISIAKLTDCLMQEKGANIVSGAKVVVKRNDEGISNNKYSVYLKQIKSPQTVSPDGKSVTTSQVQFHSYNIEKRFAARPWDISGNLICTEYSYWESGFQMSPQESCDANDATPPATYNYDWRSRIYLQPGKPQIAAAVQNSDNVVFLVLTATIQKDTPIETPAAEERKK